MSDYPYLYSDLQRTVRCRWSADRLLLPRQHYHHYHDVSALLPDQGHQSTNFTPQCILVNKAALRVSGCGESENTG